MPADSNAGAQSPEHYTVGYGNGIQAWHGQRSAENCAEFLLPHLRAGMNLLDCGCGPGSITLGFATILGSGRVIGIDREPHQLERASALAVARSVRNINFAAGNIYDLPFPDSTFDAVFAHHVLEHLRQPIRALREMRRVLKPGGVIGVRDPDFGIATWVPSTSILEAASKLTLRVREEQGGSPFYARNLRYLLGEAGFTSVEAFAFVEHQGTTESARSFAHVLVEVLTSPSAVDAAISHGWADQNALKIMADAVTAWAEEPGAFRAVLDCAAIGWVPSPSD